MPEEKTVSGPILDFFFSIGPEFRSCLYRLLHGSEAQESARRQ